MPQNVKELLRELYEFAAPAPSFVTLVAAETSYDLPPAIPEQAREELFRVTDYLA